MGLMFIKPADGRNVRDPKTLLHLPSEGAFKPDDDGYWLRRLAEGDVVLIDPPTETKSTPAPTARRAAASQE